MIRANLKAGADLHDFNVTASATGINPINETVAGSSDYDYLLINVKSSVMSGAGDGHAYYCVGKNASVTATLSMNDGTSQTATVARSGDSVSVTGTLAGKMVGAVIGTNDPAFA